MKRKKNKNKYFSTQAAHISICSKIILIILIIGMMLGHLNIGAVVQAMQPEEHINLSEEIERDFSGFEKISEVDELRTENSKTYVKENGMYETEYYSEKVHYKDNNKWKEIDNSFQYADKCAKNYKKYDLLFNNCLHYVKTVLWKGIILNPLLNLYIRSTSTITPVLFYLNASIINPLKPNRFTRILVRGLS